MVADSRALPGFQYSSLWLELPAPVAVSVHSGLSPSSVGDLTLPVYESLSYYCVGP